MTITEMSDIKEPTNGVFTDESLEETQTSESTTSNQSTLAKNIIFGTIAIIAYLVLRSRAAKIAFQISPVVPAARGYAKVKKDSNKNYNIYVSIEDLAEPNRLNPAKETYVVWLMANDNSIKNVGQIKTSTSILSHTLKGSFETVSISKLVKVFITAEDDATVLMPEGILVLTTNVF